MNPGDLTIRPEAEWRAALEDGRLLLQRARSSGTVIFPPRIMQPRDGDTELEWIAASGLGTVYSVTVVGQKPPAEPYNVVLVDLDDGVRVMSRVEGVEATHVAIGMRVRVRIGRQDGVAILLFDPV